MASLLFWWSTDGAPIDNTIWRRMVAQAAKDAGLEKPPETWIEGPNYRALAIRTLRIEPEPVRRIEPGILLLSALRHPMTDREILNPPFEEPAAVICFDQSNQTLQLTRDFLGHRWLVWSKTGSHILVASREESLLAHPAVSFEVDEFHIACRVNFLAPSEQSTPFRAIRCVPAGSTVEFRNDHAKILWRDPEPDDAGFTACEYTAASALLERLDDTVARSVMGAARVGAHLSAGLDSPSIVASLVSQFSAEKLAAVVSYGFSQCDGADADERVLARQLCDLWGLEQRTIDASTIPLCLAQRDPKTPLVMVLLNFFEPLIRETFKVLHAQNADIVLTGYAGDDFLHAPANWASSAFSSRRWDIVRKSYGYIRRKNGIIRALRDPSLRRLINYIARGRSIYSNVPLPTIADPQFRERWIEESCQSIKRFKHWPIPQSANEFFGTASALHRSLTHLYPHSFGIDVRHPFSDYTYARYALSLPTFLWTQPGASKLALRIANKDRLPEYWLERERCGSLTPLFRRAYEHVARTDRESGNLKVGLSCDSDQFDDERAVRDIWRIQAELWRTTAAAVVDDLRQSSSPITAGDKTLWGAETTPHGP
nr:asparagine synthetase B family protein [Pseudoxanthomonas sp.]